MITLLFTFMRVVLTLTGPLCNCFLDVLYRFLMGKSRQLPPIRNRILLMSATELAENIRKQKITAEEVMRAYIARIREVNPIINACVDQRFEMAISDAKAVDMMIEAKVKSERELAVELPLLGVPFSCKEMIGVKGLAQTNGLVSFRDRKAPSDAEVVEHYKKAGAIPVVVTNVPIISMWWETSNKVFGRTINPYDNRRTVGGSTGGEGALLASAGSVMGIGTDIGGSIRIPSAFCGVYGHKPSRGVISNQRPWPVQNNKYEPFRSTGPMCRYARDLKMLVRVLSGDSAPTLRLDDEVDFRKVKIFYMEELPGLLLSATPTIKSAVKKAVYYLEETYGVSATKLELKEMAYAFHIWQCKILEADGPPIRKALVDKDGNQRNWHWELLKTLFNRSEFDFPISFFATIEKDDKDKYYYRGLQMYEDLSAKLEEYLAGDAILLLPTHPDPAPHIMTTVPRITNVGYTAIFNALGYAVTNIPAGMSGNVPIGLQVVAHHQDRLTLAAAVELDKVFKGWQSPSLIEL